MVVCDESCKSFVIVAVIMNKTIPQYGSSLPSRDVLHHSKILMIKDAGTSLVSFVDGCPLKVKESIKSSLSLWNN